MSEAKRILHLTLFRKWFEQIASGEKTEEYRDVTDYWTHRLHGKTYDEIYFKNGYARNAPFMRVEWKGVKLGRWNGRVVFAIQIGKILEVRNYEPTKGQDVDPVGCRCAVLSLNKRQRWWVIVRAVNDERTKVLVAGGVQFGKPRWVNLDECEEWKAPKKSPKNS